jgi:hypothetical protein
MMSMPKGWLKPVRKVVRTSGLPSWLVSRSSVMRLALLSRSERDLSSFSSAATFLVIVVGMVLASATSTSPLGATYIQRGLSNFPAYSATVKPAGAVGVRPAGQGSMSTRCVTDFVT